MKAGEVWEYHYTWPALGWRTVLVLEETSVRDVKGYRLLDLEDGDLMSWTISDSETEQWSRLS